MGGGACSQPLLQTHLPILAGVVGLYIFSFNTPYCLRACIYSHSTLQIVSVVYVTLARENFYITRNEKLNDGHNSITSLPWYGNNNNMCKLNVIEFDGQHKPGFYQKGQGSGGEAKGKYRGMTQLLTKRITHGITTLYGHLLFLTHICCEP